MKIDMKELKARIKSEKATLKKLAYEAKAVAKSATVATKAYDKQKALIEKLESKIPQK